MSPETPLSPKVLFFTKGVAINPASRYRFLQYLPYFRQYGFETEVKPLFGEDYYRAAFSQNRTARFWGKTASSLVSFARRSVTLFDLSQVDLVVVENQLFPYDPGVLESLLFASAKRTIFEFDDAIYLTPLHQSKLRRILAKADLVIVGNEHLAGFVHPVNSKVAVVPTVIDLLRYHEPEPEPHEGPLRLGWVGLPSTMKYLDIVVEPLRRLAQEIPIEFRVVSSKKPEIEGVPLRFIPWEEASEAQELARLDVGIMPLSDDEWARGKCGAKLLQYMAAGRAAVASPVGVNRSILVDGETGLLARSGEDWYHALKFLAEHPERRAAMGRAGRSRVAEHYSLQTWAPRVAELYRKVIEGGK